MKIIVDQFNRKIYENWYYVKFMKIGIIIKILMKFLSILFVEVFVSLVVVLCICRVLLEFVRKVCLGLE